MLVLSVLASTAGGQDLPETSGNVQTLHPSIDAEQTLWTDDAALAGSGTFTARTLLSWTYRPLVWDTGSEIAPIVDSAWQLDLIGAATVGPFRLGVDVPVLLSTTSAAGDSPAGLGNVAIDGKLVLVRPKDSLGIALSGRVQAPTISPGVLAPLGGPSASWEAAAILHYELGVGRLVANLGARGGAPVILGDREVGDQVFGRLGFGLPLGDRLGLSADVAARVAYGAPLSIGAPAEFGLGGWARLSRRFTLRIGAGRGLTGAVGAPAARVLVSLGVSPAAGGAGSDTREPRPIEAGPRLGSAREGGADDEDADGVATVDDRCPTEPEDGDGYLDGDGCPEPVELDLHIRDATGATVHGAFTWLQCGDFEARLPAVATATVEAGTCSINVAAPGWTFKTLTVDVPDGEPLEHAIVLNPTGPVAYLELLVLDPQGARLQGAAWRVGEAGTALPVVEGRALLALPPGSYPVRVEHEGYASHDRSVEVRAGEVQALGVTLRPVE